MWFRDKNEPTKLGKSPIHNHEHNHNANFIFSLL